MAVEAITLEQMLQSYRRLTADLQAGRMTQAQYAAAVADLQGVDSAGHCWKVQPGGKFSMYDGTRWTPATPAGLDSPVVHARPSASPRQANAPAPSQRPRPRPQPAGQGLQVSRQVQAAASKVSALIGAAAAALAGRVSGSAAPAAPASSASAPVSAALAAAAPAAGDPPLVIQTAGRTPAYIPVQAIRPGDPPGAPLAAAPPVDPDLPAEQAAGQAPPPEVEPAPTPPGAEQNLPGGMQGHPLIPAVAGLPETGFLKDLVEGLFNAGERTGQAVIQALPGWVDSSLFDLVKTGAGASTTVAGTLKEYLHFADSPETVQAVNDALAAWQNNPTAAAAEDYVKSLGKTVDGQVKKLADELDIASRGIDLIEAVEKGLAESEREGFTAPDQSLAGAGRQWITWGLTKNPVVVVADWAAGATCQALRGKEGRVEIGAAVDQAGEAWKDAAREYGVQAGDRNAEQFLSSIRRIKSQIERGEITRAEGSLRAHKLQQIQSEGAQ